MLCKMVRMKMWTRAGTYDDGPTHKIDLNIHYLLIE